MELQLRQLRTLIKKNLLLRFSGFAGRSGTIHTAITLPIIISVFLVYITRIFLPGGQYGIGSPSPVDNLVNAMGQKSGKFLVLMNNASSTGGLIDDVIQNVASAPQAAGYPVVITDSTDVLRSTCRSNIAGASDCFAAIVFQSSPNEGSGNIWNYTVRADASLGLSNLDVGSNTNDVQINILPLQHAIDLAISSVNDSALSNSTDTTVLPSNVQNFLFTSRNMDEQMRHQAVTLLQTNIVALAVVWLLILITIPSSLVSLMAKERETEMTDLIESVMPNKRRWEPQFIRLLALHFTFVIIYFASWIFASIIFKIGYLKYTSYSMVFLAFVLGGLAMTSFSLLGGAFFKRAQLSAVIVLGVSILLGVAAQITNKSLSDSAMIVTSFLFMPMNFVNYILYICHFEHENQAVNLSQGPPNSNSGVKGYIFIIIFIIQIFVYPILAIFVERMIHGAAASRHGRQISMNENLAQPPVVVSNASKVYKHSVIWGFILRLFGKSTEPVHAVKDLSLQAIRGQIMVLVGANGCGKSTTLNAIAGLHSMSTGSIIVDGSGGIGICPQKNVMWNSLSVRQHAHVFNSLKTVEKKNLKKDLNQLYLSCGLDHKINSRSRDLSGGQKRKLQLLMMLTGGSQVCCVDEASGGLDPLSRRKIWDILLAERGKRTVILTTHFLDEAEFLSDNMVIMSEGKVGAEGSVSELKNKLGNGYRVELLTPKTMQRGEDDINLNNNERFDESETFGTAKEALNYIQGMDDDGITNYQIAGPTMEEVFMKLAADPESEYKEIDDTLHTKISRVGEKGQPINEVETVHQIGLFKQAWVLFNKRITVWRRNPFPLLFPLIIPIVAASLLTRFIENSTNPGCSINDRFETAAVQDLSDVTTPQFLIGPTNTFNENTLDFVSDLIVGTGVLSQNNNSASSLVRFVHFVNSFSEFNSFVQSNYSSIIPGGFYAGDSATPPTFAIRSDLGILGVFSGIVVQNLLDVILTGVKIATQFAPFDITFPTNTGDSLQFIAYVGLVYAAAPAFFTLYTNQERVRNVRAMQYSNGVRPLPLWSAYLLFDWIIVLFSSAIVTIIFSAASSSAWYHLGYIFLVLILYGWASILLAYLISKIAKSHFASFAFCAGGQALMFLIFLTSFWTVQLQSDPDNVDRNLKIVYYVIGIISPITQLLKALFVGLNVFSVLCVGSPPVKETYPANFDQYGGPIFFLIIQSLFMFALLLWSEHSFSFGPLNGYFKRKSVQVKDHESSIYHREPEVVDEEKRVLKDKTKDGLQITAVSKYFGTGKKRIVAVDDLTLGVKSGEVFALVGVNGAGKSTSISMLRGDINPTQGDLSILNIPLATERYRARHNLGVCPQFDAIDTLSVREHLELYARIRGVVASSISQVVDSMLASVGLVPFQSRMASKLSGGNKRKLSLAMALVGNPRVVLLDEPSSGMDPVAKRNMWRTLAKFRPGRSILLTTHSMEEADALANRVGVLNRRLLEIGGTGYLRGKYGRGIAVHIVMANSPSTTESEMTSLDLWMKDVFPGSEMEGIAWKGQVRYRIPVDTTNYIKPMDDPKTESLESKSETEKELRAENQEVRSVGQTFLQLEENKEKLGIKFYSVSPSTFDEVFLKIIERHKIEEEGAEPTVKKSIWKKLRFF